MLSFCDKFNACVFIGVNLRTLGDWGSVLLLHIAQIHFIVFVSGDMRFQSFGDVVLLVLVVGARLLPLRKPAFDLGGALFARFANYGAVLLSHGRSNFLEGHGWYGVESGSKKHLGARDKWQ